MKRLIFFFLVSLFIKTSIGEASQTECQDYKLKLKEARNFFKSYKELDLNLTLRSAFIKNYNNAIMQMSIYCI